MHLELFRIPLEPSSLDDQSGKFVNPPPKNDEHDVKISVYPLINGGFNDRF